MVQESRTFRSEGNLSATIRYSVPPWHFDIESPAVRQLHRKRQIRLAQPFGLRSATSPFAVLFPDHPDSAPLLVDRDEDYRVSKLIHIKHTDDFEFQNISGTTGDYPFLSVLFIVTAAANVRWSIKHSLRIGPKQASLRQALPEMQQKPVASDEYTVLDDSQSLARGLVHTCLNIRHYIRAHKGTDHATPPATVTFHCHSLPF